MSYRNFGFARENKTLATKDLNYFYFNIAFVDTSPLSKLI